MPGLLSNWLSQQRSKRILPFVHGDVLDVGCGDVKNLKIFEENSIPVQSYTGIEGDIKRVETLSRTYPDHTFHQKDLDADPLDLGQSYDTILMLAVIEHIFNQKFLMEELLAHLKPNGKIVLTTPTPFGNDIVHRVGTAIGLFDSEGGQEDHIVIYNKRRMTHLAREFHLKLVHYQTFQIGCNQIAVLSR